jgi:hypothetical protein
MFVRGLPTDNHESQQASLREGTCLPTYELGFGTTRPGANLGLTVFLLPRGKPAGRVG